MNTLKGGDSRISKICVSLVLLLHSLNCRQGWRKHHYFLIETVPSAAIHWIVLCDRDMLLPELDGQKNISCILSEYLAFYLELSFKTLLAGA